MNPAIFFMLIILSEKLRKCNKLYSKVLENICKVSYYFVFLFAFISINLVKFSVKKLEGNCENISAGRIKWARSLEAHLDELLSNVTTHHVLKNLPAAVELSRKHTTAQAMLKAYEEDIVALWMNQHVN